MKIKQAYGQDIRLGQYGRSLVDVTMVGKGVHTMPQTRDHMYIHTHTIGILLTWQGAKSRGYFLEMYLQGAKRSKEVCRIVRTQCHSRAEIPLCCRVRGTGG